MTSETVNFERAAAVTFTSAALCEVIIVRTFLMMAKAEHGETGTSYILIFDAT